MTANPNTSTQNDNLAGALGKEALAVAFEAADRASEVLKHHYGRLSQVDEKFQAGLVSEADRESESVIKEVIFNRFPQHEILGEETGLSKHDAVPKDATPKDSTRHALQPRALLMIDPLDGTTNYVHRVPFFCSSLGLEVDGDILVGVVDAPLLGARYHAVRGGGAFLNGQPISASKRTEFRDGLFATGFSSADTMLDEQLELVSHTIRRARGIRRLGAAALDLCYVAEGIFDGFWERNLQPWDTCAGALIAREAGAIATDYEGRDFEPRAKSILCAAAVQHAAILKIMGRVQNSRLDF